MTYNNKCFQHMSGNNKLDSLSNSLLAKGKFVEPMILGQFNPVLFRATLNGINHNAILSMLTIPKSKRIKKINQCPLTRVSENEFIEGYWKIYIGNVEIVGGTIDIDIDDNDDDNYPMPLATKQYVDEIFLEKCEEYMCIIDNLQFFTRDGCCVIIYKGVSKCRICNLSNGSKEYRIKKGNTIFRIPIGLLHYYKIHHVQPSKKFYNFIMNQDELVIVEQVQ